MPRVPEYKIIYFPPFFKFVMIDGHGAEKEVILGNSLEEKKFVATVPGSSFGINGEGFLRISYASKLENLKKFVNLLTQYMDE